MTPADGAAPLEAPVVEDPRPGLPTRPPRHPLTVPIWGLFLMALVAALVWAAPFLLPVTTAVLFYFILSAPRRALARIGIPAPVTALGVTALLIGAIVFAGIVLADPVTKFVADIPTLLERSLSSLTAPGGPLEAFAVAADATEEVVAQTGAQQPVPVEMVSDSGIAYSLVSVAPGVLGQIVFSVCLLFFLVSSGDMFTQKAVQSMDRFEDKRRTVRTVRAIEERLGNYLGAITLINVGLGVAIGAAMWWWGLPSPWLIGIMATFLNFIPFVGAVIGALVTGLVAFTGSMDLWFGLGAAGTYYLLTSIEGQFVTPTLVGRRLSLNVTMVFLSVAFFAWIWSVMGMVVAVPTLVVLKIVCDAVPRLRKLGLFLGDAEGFIPVIKDDEPDAAKV
ncbi:AI-2E family transporter [Jannaschia sp. Os4]|uniref:AI-2E family transporter n=1 Tax=Jannaschia sp. Os4 TaxID=2807617 RepID=UPI0019397676|nr:AI-2E family transporter [Jannaschia sp. Os4]